MCFDREYQDRLIDHMLKPGVLDRFHEVKDRRYGPTLTALALLEPEVQLFREDLEGCLEGDVWLLYNAWMQEESLLQEFRLYEMFLKGIFYERNNPNQWSL